VSIQQHQQVAAPPHNCVHPTTRHIHKNNRNRNQNTLLFILIFAQTTAILNRRPLKDHPTATYPNIDKDQQQQQHKATKSCPSNKTNKLQRRRITAYILQSAPYTNQSEPQSKHNLFHSCFCANHSSLLPLTTKGPSNCHAP
jgi:hypothetical protein